MSQKLKISLAILISLIFISLSFVVFVNFRIRIFYGNRNDALNTLNGVVQSLSAIVAIVFTIVIVVVQTTLGKYVTKAAWYVISDWVNILMLFLYVCTIAIALMTMWNINYEFWTTMMDVTMTASLVCLGALIPFFLRMPQSLNPTLIMSQVKNEILDACKTKNFNLMSDKTNLLFSMITKANETGDVEYAFEGFRLMEEVVRLEEARENEWMFLNLVQSLLDNLAMQSLKRNPNITLRAFVVYTTITNKVEHNPTIFVNIANRIVQSVVEICREAIKTRFANALLSQASFMIIDFYRSYVLLGFYAVSILYLDQNLREVLKMNREAGIFETSPLVFQTNHAIMELLKNGKEKEALHIVEIVFGEYPTGSPSVKSSIIRLIMDSKAEGFEDFASESLEIVKKKLAPFTIDVVYDPQEKTGTETSVKSDGSMEIKTGDKKREEAATWIKQQLIY